MQFIKELELYSQNSDRFGKYSRPYCDDGYSFSKMSPNETHKMCKSNASNDYYIINKNNQKLVSFTAEKEDVNEDGTLNKGYVKIFGKSMEGEFKDGNLNGKGQDYKDNTLFVGEFKDGKRYKGKLTNDYNNSVYYGEFKDDKFNGQGTFSWNKILLEGEFKNGKLWTGVEKSSNFDGELKNGKRWNGKGIEYNSNSVKIYDGELKNGKWDGQGKSYSNWNGKLLYEGEFKQGKPHGQGKIYNDGALIFDGEFKEDKRWNGQDNINLGKKSRCKKSRGKKSRCKKSRDKKREAKR